MNPEPSTLQNPRSTLKESTGWFAAGQSFRRALTLLSDGAFKLFAHVCLEADRRTGRFEASHKELASALGKSKRIIGRYVAELQAGQICEITPARNQYARTTFEVCDAFWPYRRLETSGESAEFRQYLDSVRECFLNLGCTSSSFGAADHATAKDLYERRIPVGLVRDALLMGALRKYTSWLNGTPSEPIQRLRYFESVIAEVQDGNPMPPGYSSYLQHKLESVAAAWTQTKSAPCATAVAITASREEEDFSTDRRMLAQKGNQQTPFGETG